ncbi:MAG: EamA family transporter [Chromatiaceae bacterium]|nr:MAG: EamA family transporter [Chromatiaceae bacterium]
MEWFALTLLCAFSLASADAATKAWLRNYSAAELTLVRFTLSGLLLLPLLVGLPDPRTLPAAFWGWMGLSVPLEIAAMLLYMAAIRDHPLSLTLPYLAFTPAFVVLVAWLLLGERIGAAGIGGILLVVAGAWLLNSGAARRSDWRSWLRPLTAIRWEPGARMMLAVAVLYAGTAVTGKAAMAYLGPRQFGAFYFAVIGALVAVLFALPLAGRRSASLRRLWRRPLAVLLVAALNAVMVLTHFLAIQLVEVAYMIAVKRTSLVFGILYGVLLFGEHGLRTRLPAGLLMLAGVALILLG